MEEVRAELTGSVWRILATVGATVTKGEELMILESMKMEIPVESPVDGTIESIEVAEGDIVESGTLLAKVALS